MDKWLLSKLNSAVKAVDNNLENYRIPEAARALDDFVDEMSNWYVRCSRERFWAKGMEQDKINAYMTLYTALVTISKAAAPMVPFMTEEIYRNLVCSIDPSAPESIHLCDFPAVNEDYIDTKLEDDMEEVLKIVVMGRAARNAANIKNRQPIGNMYVKAASVLDDVLVGIIENELNIKKITPTDDVSSFASYSFKPQLRTVGPKYGKHLGGIQKTLASLDGTKAMADLKANGAIEFEVDGTNIRLAEEDLLISTEKKDGFITEADNYVTVVLDTNLSEELLEEGYVLEVISKIQTMRKDSGFEVMDHIKVAVSGNDKLGKIVMDNKDSIATKVLADEITTEGQFAISKEWTVNGEKVTISLEKA